MVPLDLTHRAIVHHNDDTMEWRWFKSLDEAREWLEHILKYRK
jgi:hypothetical protein